MPQNPSYRTIVIGSGASGLFVALEARQLGPVLVLTKGSIDDCNTRWAQGGLAAAVGPLDTPEEHLADTIEAGAGLVDEAAARILCTEAPARIRDLISYGVAFDSLGDSLALGREAAHGRARIVHAGGDRTGAEIERALSIASRQPDITVLDFALATQLLLRNGRILGVEALDLRSGQRQAFEAPAVVLATGGAGQLYSHTTNPDVATGDGVALAFEAGAEVADMEFYQFHPTALRLPGAPAFLISEAVRGEGAVLRNAAGDAFMSRYHPLRDLAPRDVVARAMATEMHRANGDNVWLDCTEIKGVDLAVRFPGIFAFCQEHGIDLRSEPIPVAPAAHYFMGGVRTDTCGRTTIAGLYACGEVACTGVHGANRLASNSLMETVVFGKRVAEHIASEEGGSAPLSQDAIPLLARGGATPSKAELQRLMWQSAGIERNERDLASAIEVASSWPSAPPADDRDGIERQQMATVARLMLRAAYTRTESRGAHYRPDHSDRNDTAWQRRLVYRRGD